MNNERIWQALVASAIFVFACAFFYSSNVNQQLYRECLAANMKLLETSPESVATRTHYCRY